MIRVAYLIESSNAAAGGATTAFLSILDAAATRPDQIAPTSYFLRPPQDDVVWQRIRQNPEQFVLADSRGWAFGPGELGKTAGAALKAGKHDVLHIEGLWCPDLVYAANTARRAGIPVLWQSHGMLIRWAMNYKRLKKKIFLALGLGRALRNTTGFICPTRDELINSVLPASCPADRRFLIPLPVRLPAQMPDRPPLRAAGQQRFRISPDSFVFAFLGRLHPVKRVEMTIEAFARAAGPNAAPLGSPNTADSSRSPARLLILGKGSDEYEGMLRNLAQSLGVADQVIFAGWISDEAKREGLAAADSLVVNSSMESFGYVLFEAICAGTPVIVTDNISLAREFGESGAAIVGANSLEGVADAMRRMAVIPQHERDEMARRGFAWSHAGYSTETVGRQLEDAYRLVCRAAGNTRVG